MVDLTKPIDWTTLLHDLSAMADDIALHYFQQRTLSVSCKDDMSPVTKADQEIETKVLEYINTKIPALGILGEEYGKLRPEAPFRLIIDPIDATENFIRQIPIFGSLMAIEHDGTIIAGMVSAPALKGRWYASLGKGAFYNDSACRVSTVSDLSKAQAFHGSLFGRETTETPPQLLSLLKSTYRQRGMGDFYAHLLVAMGCGEFAVDFGLSPWDIAPLSIIVQEAGGVATDLSGNTSIYTGSLISSNTLLHPAVLDQLTS